MFQSFTLRAQRILSAVQSVTTQWTFAIIKEVWIMPIFSVSVEAVRTIGLIMHSAIKDEKCMEN